jgi:hypothetical protein
MKSKLVLWGTNASEERILIAMQLRTTDNKVDIWTFPEAIATPEFSQQMLNDWRNDVEIAFPEGATYSQRELSLVDSILPDDIKAERPDLVSRAQTEWQFTVLSTKLHQQYKDEINELGDKVAQLSEYSGEVWDSLKGFWNKVQTQVKEKNLYRDHADELRDITNSLFTQVKDKRTVIMNEFEENSRKWYGEFSATLDTVERHIEEGIKRFPEIFEQLKNTQTQFKGQRLTKEHSNELWNRLDSLFKAAKESRFGAQPDDVSMVERLTRRLEGLINAVDKMTDSIDADKRELEFQRKRQANSEGQLEAQLRQAKMNILIEKIKSKEEKLAEMLKTKQEVETKVTSARQRETQREQKREAAPKAEAAAETPAPAPVFDRPVEVVHVPSTVATETPTVVEAPAAVVETPSVVEAPAAVVETPSVVEAPAAVVETPSVVEAPVAVVETPSVVEAPVAVVETPSVVEAPVAVETGEYADEMANANAALEAVDALA